MGIYEVPGPDGGTYQVKADTPQNAIVNLQKAFSITPQMSPGAHALDVAKGAGVGLGQGAIDVVGLPGTVQELATMGANALMGDRSPEALAGALQKEGAASVAPQQSPAMGKLPTSEQIRSKVEEWTGPFYEPKSREGQYAKTIAATAPAAVVGPQSLGVRALTNVIIPGAASETAGQIYKGDWREPYARLAGGAFGALAPSALARAVTPSRIDAGRRAAVETLRNEGVTDLSAGQITGSQPLRYAESAFGGMPGAGGRSAATMANQKEQFTRAVLARVGEDADAARPEIIDRAFTRIGNQIEAVATRNRVQLDRQLGQELVNVEGEYNNLVNASQRAPVIQNFIRDIGDAAARNNGVLDGATYQAWRSRLAALERRTNDPHLSDALSGVRNALDDAFERSMMRANNRADFEAMREARTQYRNMLVVERAVTAAGEDAAGGLLSPAQMRIGLNNQNRRDYARGRGDFADLVRAGNEIMTPLPNSGTGQRAAITSSLMALGGAAGGITGDAGTAVSSFLGSAALPSLVGRVVTSPMVQGYMGNQLLPPAFRELMPMRNAQAQSLLGASLIVADPNRPRASRLRARPEDEL